VRASLTEHPPNPILVVVALFATVLLVVSCSNTNEKVDSESLPNSHSFIGREWDRIREIESSVKAQEELEVLANKIDGKELYKELDKIGFKKVEDIDGTLFFSYESETVIDGIFGIKTIYSVKRDSGGKIAVRVRHDGAL